MLRRNFMKKIRKVTSVGMAVIMLGMFFTGCSSKDGEEATPKEKNRSINYTIW